MKTMNEIERQLMGDFTIESLMGDHVEVYNMPKYSESIQLCAMQEQYAFWCVSVKKLLLADLFEPNTIEGRFAGLMKAHMVEYATDEANHHNKAMRYLYDVTNIEILVRQISMLARYSHYKDAPDFKNIPEEMRANSLNPENVSLSIALYVVFTILVNESINVDQFNDLFVNAWFNYYETWFSREFLFTMRGNATHDDFAGVLIGQ